MAPVPDDFVIARNPDDDSTLPYVLRIPLGADGIVLKARETWPRTSKVYCHRVEEWPADAEVVERVGSPHVLRSWTTVARKGRQEEEELAAAGATEDAERSLRPAG